MDIQEERGLFLAHMRSIGSAGFMFELDEDGNFDDMSMSYAWSAWQAAKAQAVPKWFVAKEIKPAENNSDEKVLTWGKVSGVRLVPVWSFKSVTDVTHWIPLPDAPQEQAND